MPATDAPALRIGGLERLSVVDWPGELVAVVFCQGCAWNCRYCHNPHLIPFAHRGEYEWEKVRDWLRGRRGLLDGVVFSGGEATFQTGLLSALREVRGLGFRTGLHTGGPVPERFAPLLEWLDWVGFDFKAPFDRYAKVTRSEQGHRAEASFRHLLASGVSHEIRTTWHPALLSAADLHSMAQTLEEAGCRQWVIQRFRPEGCEDELLCREPVGELPALPKGGRLEIVVR